MSSSLPPRPISPWLWVLKLLCFVFAVYAVEEDIEYPIATAGLEQNLGTLGGAFDRDSDFAPGYVGVTSVTPNGPLAAAGVHAGDHLRFDRTYDYTRKHPVGEAVGASLDHNGTRTHLALTAAASPPGNTLRLLTVETFNSLGCLLVTLLGVFIAWRARNLTILALGAALLSCGGTEVIPPLLLSAVPVFLSLYWVGALVYGAIPLLFYVFAVGFYRSTIGPLSRAHLVGLAIYGVVQMATSLIQSDYLLTVTRFPLAGDGYLLSNITTYLGFAGAFGYLFIGWRRSPAANQQRYALLLTATSAMIVSQALITLAFFVLVLPDAESNLLVAASVALGGFVAPPLFTYSIFRHRVFDLGFAVNRTLVYGILSALLLVVFGLIEWASEHFLPIENRETNALLDAGIALCIFLVFHRVRDFVEHNIEKLFFHTWHQKEAKLKRFVREAAFILKRDPMIAAYVAAVEEFCESAEVALYLADDEGTFRLVEGGLAGQPDILDADAKFMVTLRADRVAFEPEMTRIALALPMIHRTEVIGVTLLGPKATGFGYRPDEKAVLADAAHQIGIDLHALEVERLQKRVTVLDIELAALKGPPAPYVPA